MGLFDFFKKNKPRPAADLDELTLERLQPGDLVDYDLKTWQVKARHRYEWGEDDVSLEWQLRSGDDMVYLELQRNDEDDWSLSRPIDFDQLGPEVPKAIKENGDPPEEIVFHGETFYLEEMAGGHFFKDGFGSGEALLRWDYENEAGDKYLSVEQWGENDFEAFLGRPVEEYQFSNLLPGKRL